MNLVGNPRKEPPLGTLVFYISGHGFGHASRVIEVINALVARRPDVRIIVRTTAAKWLFDRTVRGPFRYDDVECDTGIVQIDSLHLDEHASVRRAMAFISDFDARVDREAAALRDASADLVVSDMPALGVAAGARVGVPSVAFGNFTWDWVYSAYAGSGALVGAIAGAYAQADVAVRLPMWGGFDAFNRVIDVPFVARHALRDPAETRRALGVPTDTRVVLSSFGGHGVEGFDTRALAQMDGYIVLFSSSVPAGVSAAVSGGIVRLDETRLYAEGFRYADLVRAADVVVTKPGYGIIAECIANDTAILYTSRGHFIEYDVLVREMPKYLRAAFVDHADLFAGRWQPHLDAVLAQPAPLERPATNGAEITAELLLKMI